MHKRMVLSSLCQNIDTFVYRWYNCVKQGRKTAALFTAFYVQKNNSRRRLKLTIDFKLYSALRAPVTP